MNEMGALTEAASPPVQVMGTAWPPVTDLKVEVNDSWAWANATPAMVAATKVRVKSMLADVDGRLTRLTRATVGCKGRKDVKTTM